MTTTTKHHEGFCLWDSKFTDYKAPNTPAKRDVLREIVDAFRAEGLRIGFYYSLLDWHHPQFPIDPKHPLRNRPAAEIAEMNRHRDVRKYAKYMRDQVTELLTNYGRIDILWFDFSYPNDELNGTKGKGRADWESEKLVALARRLQPQIILDNRLDLPGAGDITTPEQFQPEHPPRRADGSIAPWEGCQTFSGSWGYHRDEATWKSDKQCVEMLIRHVARGGNLIMNVGPREENVREEDRGGPRRRARGRRRNHRVGDPDSREGLPDGQVPRHAGAVGSRDGREPLRLQGRGQPRGDGFVGRLPEVSGET